MKKFISRLRVRYGETDQMGVVHHANYALYLELARVEWLKEFALSYKEMEENGIMMPVYDMGLTFKKPAYFDEVLSVETQLLQPPSVRIKLGYKILNKHEELLTDAHTELIFVNSKNNKPIRCPDDIYRKIMKSN